MNGLGAAAEGGPFIRWKLALAPPALGLVGERAEFMTDEQQLLVNQNPGGRIVAGFQKTRAQSDRHIAESHGGTFQATTVET
jgi:hypothetical protein